MRVLIFVHALKWWWRRGGAAGWHYRVQAVVFSCERFNEYVVMKKRMIQMREICNEYIDAFYTYR